MSQDENQKKEYNFKEWSVKELKEFSSKHNIKVPSKAKKGDIVALLEQVVASADFIDRTEETEAPQQELPAAPPEQPVELVAEFEEDKVEQPPFMPIVKEDQKFWQKPPFSTLLDVELAKGSDVAFYDLSSLVNDFFEQMVREDLVNYKISGIALKSAAQLHHYKISSVIKEEEEIQKKEEIEKLRAQHSRTIPKALPQPIQPKLQIATKDELYDAMRAAIIEAMQKKEKLKRNRMRKEELSHQRKLVKSSAKLPKEILKYITGKEQTVQELHDSWLNKINASINFEHKNETSFFDLLNIIKNEDKTSLGRRFALVRLFLALMFLSTGNKIFLFQVQEFKDIMINNKKLYEREELKIDEDV